jgi:hypothetical protein
MKNEGMAEIAVWSVAVGLLGSGAERLEATIKREIIAKSIKLAKVIINNVTVMYGKLEFDELKAKLTGSRGNSKGSGEVRIRGRFERGEKSYRGNCRLY